MKTTLRFMGLTILLVSRGRDGGRADVDEQLPTNRRALRTSDILTATPASAHAPTADPLAKGAYMGSLPPGPQLRAWLHQRRRLRWNVRDRNQPTRGIFYVLQASSRASTAIPPALPEQRRLRRRDSRAIPSSRTDGAETADWRLDRGIKIVSHEPGRSETGFALRSVSHSRSRTGDKDAAREHWRARHVARLRQRSSEMNARRSTSRPMVATPIRGEPDGVSCELRIPLGRWRGIPSRKSLRLTAEINGDIPSDGTVTVTTPIRGFDGSLAPASSNYDSITNGTIGLTYHAAKGFFVGGGFNFDLPMESREGHTGATEDSLDSWTSSSGLATRLAASASSRRHRRRHAPPPPPPPPPSSIVRRRSPLAANPARWKWAAQLLVTADAQDPDGDTLSNT